MVNVKYQLLTKFGLIYLIVAVFSCSPAPRYNSHVLDKEESIIKEKFNKSSLKKKKQKKTLIKNKTKNQIKLDLEKKVYKGLSSYYGKKFHGKLTANGEVYDMYGLTAAHKTFPLNTICRVTNISNKKSLILRINDRGPYVGERILDCSYGAAKKLGFLNEGVTEVKIEIIEWGDNIYMHHDRH